MHAAVPPFGAQTTLVLQLSGHLHSQPVTCSHDPPFAGSRPAWPGPLGAAV